MADEISDKIKGVLKAVAVVDKPENKNDFAYRVNSRFIMNGVEALLDLKGISFDWCRLWEAQVNYTSVCTNFIMGKINKEKETRALEKIDGNLEDSIKIMLYSLERWECPKSMDPLLFKSIKKLCLTWDPYRSGVEDSISIGSLLSAIPLGVMNRNDASRAHRYARIATRITHNNELCKDAAGFLSVFIGQLMSRDKEKAFETALSYVKDDELRERLDNYDKSVGDLADVRDGLAAAVDLFFKEGDFSRLIDQPNEFPYNYVTLIAAALYGAYNGQSDVPNVDGSFDIERLAKYLYDEPDKDCLVFDMAEVDNGLYCPDIIEWLRSSGMSEEDIKDPKKILFYRRAFRGKINDFVNNVLTREFNVERSEYNLPCGSHIHVGHYLNLSSDHSHIFYGMPGINKSEFIAHSMSRYEKPHSCDFELFCRKALTERAVKLFEKEFPSSIIEGDCGLSEDYFVD